MAHDPIITPTQRVRCVMLMTSHHAAWCRNARSYYLSLTSGNNRLIYMCITYCQFVSRAQVKVESWLTQNGKRIEKKNIPEHDPEQSKNLPGSSYSALQSRQGTTGADCDIFTRA